MDDDIDDEYRHILGNARVALISDYRAYSLVIAPWGFSASILRMETRWLFQCVRNEFGVRLHFGPIEFEKHFRR